MFFRRPSVRFAWGRLFLTILIFGVWFAGPEVLAGCESSTVLCRDEQPVLVTGSRVPELRGRAIDSLAAFAYEPGSSSYEPIPFQLDEKLLRVFNPDTELQFTELMYDVFGEDDGLLDDDDELAVLFADGGPRAPGTTPWPDGADAVGYEIEIVDPRPSAPEPSRWIYLFAGSALARSPETYVSWDGLATTSIVTDHFAVDYEDRWLLTGYRVFPTCGSGSDLLDRLKGRAIPFAGQQEDEEGWNDNSVYLGGLSGPVRAIRYVRGATSGVNTTHRDLVYRGFWKRQLNMRVHPINSAWLYLDWLPIPDAFTFTPTKPQGVTVDGIPDSVPTTFNNWGLFRSREGGLVAVYDIPPSSLYQERKFHYRDDAAHDDSIPTNPDYGDDDDSAYGSAGLRVEGVGDTNTSPVSLISFLFPLCGDVGDASVGTAYYELFQMPLQITTSALWAEMGPVRTLRVETDGNDVVLDWQELAGATAYRVYAAESPDLAPGSWDLLQEVTETEYRDVGQGVLPEPRYYTVTAVNPSGEGPR